nr:TerD family protein [uncultured Moraxella sp.]
MTQTNEQQAMDVLQKIESQNTLKTTIVHDQLAQKTNNFEQNFDESVKQTAKNANLSLDVLPSNPHETEQNELALAGVLIDELAVSLKQWQFSLHWQQTRVPKSGLINRLKKRTQLMDLDLSCLLCNRYGEVVERVWFKNVRDQAESVRYQGDELLGDRALHVQKKNMLEKTDVEQKIEPKYENINLYLSNIPPHIYQIMLVISSYTGDDLNLVAQGECHLSDDEGNVISQISLPKLPENVPAVWLATLTRSANSWSLVKNKQHLKKHQQFEFEKEISSQIIRQAR